MTAQPLDRPEAPGRRFAAGLGAAFERAAGGGVERLRLEVGDIGVELRSADPTLARLIERSMGPLRVPATRPDFRVDVRIDFFAGGRLPEAPWSLAEPRARGEIGDEAPDAPYRACLQPELPALHYFDRESSRGWAWYGDAERLPSWEHPHLPLRALHFALADRGWFAVHGAVVERDGAGVLLPGRSGSGKTTTAMAALAGGYRFLGDDHVLVRPGPEAAAAALFATTRLTPRSVGMLAAIGLSAPVAAPATPPSDKALFYLADFTGVRLTRATRLAAIVLPRRAAAGGEPEPVSAAEALRDLAPSTILFLPHAGAIGTFGQLGRLVRAVPAYRLALGPDLAEVAPRLDAVLESARGGRPR